MAAIKAYAVFKEQPRIDELCPKCWNPALKTATYQQIDLSGVTPLGTRVYCRDCHIWTEDLQEFPHD